MSPFRKKTKQKERPAELKARKRVPEKAGGPMTTKKGKKGYVRKRNGKIDQEEEEISE